MTDTHQTEQNVPAQTSTSLRSFDTMVPVNHDQQMNHRTKNMTRIAAPVARQGLPAEQVEFAKRVQALPDSLFADDEEVQRLTRDAEAKDLREQRIARGIPEGDRQSLLERLRAQISEAEREIVVSTIDDALEGDHGFRRSIVLARHLEHLQRVLNAAQSAMKVMAKPLPERIAPFADEAAKARGALRSHLLELKREHVAARAQASPDSDPQSADAAAIAGGS